VPLRCVDASVLVSWLVPSQRSAAVVEVWQGFIQGRDEFVAPPLLYPECLSAIRRLSNRDLLTAAEARGLAEDALALNITTSRPEGLYQRAYDLAERYRLSTVYDCCYLALAETLSCEMLTLDQRLYKTVSHNFRWVRLVS